MRRVKVNPLIDKLAIWHAQKLGSSLVNLIVIILRAVCVILLIKRRRGIFFPPHVLDGARAKI